jgi:hypothetical protein
MRYAIDEMLKHHPGPRSQQIHWVPWNRLPAAELEQHILELMRQAGEGRHFNEHQWRGIDRMRKRLRKLQANEVVIA